VGKLERHHFPLSFQDLCAAALFFLRNSAIIIPMALLLEFLAFARARKKVWLLPLLLFAFAFGALIIAAQTSALSPFIYSLF
jgi:NAD/NADP transhydrogenase beta subunit